MGKKNNLKKKEGHKAWYKICINLIKNINKLEIHINEISFYVFSSENWKRTLSVKLITYLILLKNFIKEFEITGKINNLKIRHYGSRKKIIKKIIKYYR